MKRTLGCILRCTICGLASFCCLFLLVAFVSCSDDKVEELEKEQIPPISAADSIPSTNPSHEGSNDEDGEELPLTEENVLASIEGFYVGKFIDYSYKDSITGNVYLKKLTNGLYSFEAICDQLNLHFIADGYKISLFKNSNSQQIYSVSFYGGTGGTTDKSSYWRAGDPFMWLMIGDKAIKTKDRVLDIHFYYIEQGIYDPKKGYYFRGSPIQ